MVTYRKSIVPLVYTPTPIPLATFTEEQEEYLSSELRSISRVSKAQLTEDIQTVTSSTYSIIIRDYIIFLDGTSNTVAATLPLAQGLRNKRFLLKCIDATNTCSFSPGGSDTIDGSTSSITLLLNKFVEVISDGQNWEIIRDNR